MNYALLILLSLFFAFVLAAIFHPTLGLLARWRANSARAQREQVEDAMKYLVKQEHSGRYASPEALAGALHLSGAEALRLVTRMETQGLLSSRDGGLKLTAPGERMALHVVRAHRLMERFLADEARLPLDKVHAEAERREHDLTPEQLDNLDAALGYPDQDPHGDPIPTRTGELAPPRGVSLSAWELSQPGRIVHLEDEPPLAYAQIAAEGLRLNQTLRILEATPERYLLSDGENEYRLAPAVAANIYLAPLPNAQAHAAGVIPLADLKHDQAAEIIALDESCQGFTRRRFLDLGLTPGARIAPELQNAFGDPRGYRLRGTLIALRKDQAALIWVKPA
jgi:DtxR family Mn-dependent transcriptional regulator